MFNSKSSQKREYLVGLQEELEERFNLAELQQLCFELGVEYDDLAGTSKQAKTRELVQYMKRRNRLSKLEDAISRRGIFVDNSSSHKVALTPLLNKTILFILLFTLVVWVILWSRQQQNTSTIYLTVRVADESNKAIAGATVTIGNQSKQTTSDGIVAFSLSQGETSTDLMFIEAENYQVEEKLFSFDEQRVFIRLSPQTDNAGKVIIQVLTNDNYSFIEGADITLIVDGNIYSNQTDTHGIARFDLQFGEGKVDAQIIISSEGYQKIDRSITLLANQVSKFNLKPFTDETQ